MQFLQKHKEVFLYGLSMAILLTILRWLEVHLIILNYRIDLFVGAIAIVFTVMGIWLALKWVTPKVETVIIEKEIYKSPSPSTEINQAEIDRLGLSKRELEVLTLMATGLSNEEIAEKLFVSLNTIKTHSSSIFTKLDVKRRMQAAEKAKRLNIIM